jgi:hypothetical protein
VVGADAANPVTDVVLEVAVVEVALVVPLVEADEGGEVGALVVVVPVC